MPRHGADTGAKLIDLTRSTLQEILGFKTIVDIQKYMARRHATNYSEFEIETNIEDAFRGVGVLATKDNLGRRLAHDEQDFYLDEVPLGSYELGAYIDEFPMDAAAASYVFTLVEVYGDQVADLVSPGTRDPGKAWHGGVNGRADLRDPAQVLIAREKFARHMACGRDEVPELAAKRMVQLKKERNAFAHVGEKSITFDEFMKDAIAVVCHIAHLTTDMDRISSYPWEDHLETFVPQT